MHDKFTHGRHCSGRTTRRGRITAALLAATLLTAPSSAFAAGDSGIGAKIAEPFFSLMVGLGGIVLWFGGQLFDIAYQQLVLEMGTKINGALGATITELWRVVRDLFNLLLIFGLIWVGLQTLWNAGNARTRTTLATIIVAALFVNFSLFFVQTIVDVTNLAATEINELIIVSREETDELYQISTAFAEYLDLQTYSDITSGDSPAEVSGFHLIVYGMMSMLFMLVAGFVFAAGAILLVTRFLVLLIFMIFAPALFLGFVFPQLAGKTKAWWTSLIKHALIAPIFLFLIFLSLNVTKQFVSHTGEGSLSRALIPPVGTAVDVGAFVIILNFVVITGLMIASIIIAQKLGVAGANTVVQRGKRTANTAKRWSGRLGGWGARSLSGAAANRLNQSMQSRKYGPNTYRLLSGMKNAAANAKFGLKYSSKEVAEQKKKRNKEREQHNQVASLQQAVASGDTGRIQDIVPKLKKEQLDKLARDPNSNIMKNTAVQQSLTTAQRQRIEKSEEVDEEKKEAIGDTHEKVVKTQLGENPETGTLSQINQASKSQLQALGIDTLQKNVSALSQDQWEEVMKRDDLNDTQRQTLRESRAKVVRSALGEDAQTGELRNLQNAGKADLQALDVDTIKKNASALSQAQWDKLDIPNRKDLSPQEKQTLQQLRRENIARNLSSSESGADFADLGRARLPELETLDVETLVQHAAKLRPKQIADYAKSKTVSNENIKRVRDAWERALTNEFADAPDAFFKKGWKDDDIARLPKQILTDEKAAPHLTPKALQEIVNENLLTKEDRDTIRRNLERSAAVSDKVKEYLKSSHGQLAYF